jgi:hypothetical protein
MPIRIARWWRRKLGYRAVSGNRIQWGPYREAVHGRVVENLF